jgi:hypothetical protein
VIQISAAFVAVVLVRFLLAGSDLDLGPSLAVGGPAILTLALGWGLLSRVRMPYLADSLGLALLVMARGPLCDLMDGLLPPGPVQSWTAGLVSLGPVGYLLGRQLSSLVHEGLLWAALGWAFGEYSVMAGAVAWMPGPFTGFVAAGVFAGLVELGRHSRMPREGASDDPVAWEALPFGLTFGLAWVTLNRVVPGYATPPVHYGSEMTLGLLLPALVVAWPASVLASGKKPRRALFALGSMALAFALWKTAISLGLYQYSVRLLSVHSQIRQVVIQWGGPVTEWRAWMFVFCGLGAAGLGVVLGALGRAACGPLALGVGLAAAAGSWVLAEPFMGPQQLLLAASGVAAVATLAAWRQRALWLLPLGLLVVPLLPERQQAAFESVRRVGEPAVESFERDLLADVALFSTFGPDIGNPNAQRAYRTTFTERVPVWLLDELHGERAEMHVPHFLARNEKGDDPPTLRHFGLRFAGTPAHPDHDPMGPEGSVGRLTRVFVPPGRSFVTGIGAELLVADLEASGLVDGLVCSSPLRMGDFNKKVLLTHLDSGAFTKAVRDRPLRAGRAALGHSFGSVLLTPERPEWPGAGMVGTEENLERLARLLTPAGRCLAWLETAGMDGRALRARVSAFGRVFGERSAAFVEMRGLDPPLVLLLGWVSDEGRPSAEQFAVSLPTADETGRRSRLRDFDDLSHMLLRDGHGMLSAAGWPAHSRSRPIAPGGLALTGWAAVQGLLDVEARLETVVDGAGESEQRNGRAFAALVQHATYAFDPAPLTRAMLVEVASDVDWPAFEKEVELHVEVAAENPDSPQLHLALAALLAPLVKTGEVARFRMAFEDTGAAQMDSWRLALLHYKALELSLKPELAAIAMKRARSLAGLTPEGAARH